MSHVKHLLLAHINAPESGIYSSQTLYEALFFAMEMYGHCKSNRWRAEARHLAMRICKAQLPDGGFDIGYNFRFGAGLEKSEYKESTSPEVLSLSALALYYRQFQDVNVLGAIKNGRRWILGHVRAVGEGYAIPYAPCTTGDIHITNATSFAMSAISTTSGLVDDDCDDVDLVEKMASFMLSQLCPSGEGASYWPYFCKDTQAGEIERHADKIDNYHIGQQLYHHCVSQVFCPSPQNLVVAKRVNEYLLGLQDSSGFIPYTVKSGVSSDAVDTWGFASVILGLCGAFNLLGDSRSLEGAGKICDYLWRYCWSGCHFYPIVLNSKKVAVDRNYYPRSDAWVIHSLAMYMNCSRLDKPDWWAKLDSCYHKMKSQGFRGLENHTLTTRKRIFGNVVRALRLVRSR